MQRTFNQSDVLRKLVDREGNTFGATHNKLGVGHRDSYRCRRRRCSVSNFFKAPGLFAAYSVGLAIGFFSHVMKERSRLPGPALPLRNQFTISTAF